MSKQKGMSPGLIAVVVAMIGLVVLGATGVLIGTSQADTADTADQVASDAQCDTWATQSTTAGNPDEADNAEQQYNENCEGNLDEISEGNDFISGEGYKEDEDGALTGGRNPDINPSPDEGGSTEDGQDDSQDGSSGGSGGGMNTEVVSGAVGGGEKYIQMRKDQGLNTFCSPPSGATVLSAGTSRSQLVSAVESASSGSVVYLEGDVSISLEDWVEETGNYIEIPGGVTIASDRGCSGSEGAEIHVEDGTTDEFEDSSEFFRASDPNVVLTGLRINGPGPRSDDEPVEDGSEGAMIDTEGANIEIYNNFITNFPDNCARVQDGGHIHHNRITFCNSYGTGYTTEVYGGNITVEYNYLNHYRHAIGATADHYTFRYNYVGPGHLNHQIDNHVSDGWMDIYCNTVDAEETYSGSTHPAIGWREGPTAETSYVTSNWFGAEEDYISIGQDTDDHVLIGSDSEEDEVENLYLENNHYGTDDPGDCSIGAPREGCQGSYSCQAPEPLR